MLTLCEFYLPIERNSNGQPHNLELWQQFENALIAEFDGYTNCGNVQGFWVDDCGDTIVDVSRHYAVAVSSENLPILRCVEFVNPN